MGASLQFSGAGTDYVSVPSNANLDLTDPWTIAFWIFPTVSGTWEILEKGNIGSAGKYLVEFNTGMKMRFTIPTVANIGGSGSAYPLNAWSHCVITKSGSQYNFYLNGRLDQSPTNASSITTSTSTLIIGRRSSTALLAMQGLLDEVLLINGTALTASQVAQLYSSHVSPVAVSAQWNFNEGTGSTTADASGNGNTGTLTGPPTWSADSADLHNKYGFFSML